MIKADQMKNPMDQELVEALAKLHTGVDSFPMGCVCGNHHVTQNLRRDVAKISFLHGKGYHVRRAVMVQIGLVEFGDPDVIHDQNGQLGIRIAQGA